MSEKEWKDFIESELPENQENLLLSLIQVKTDFFKNEELIFRGWELLIEVYLDDEFESNIYLDMYCGDCSNENYETFIINNVPEFDDSEMLSSLSRLEDGNENDIALALSKLKSIDFKNLFEEDKKDFTYFNLPGKDVLHDDVYNENGENLINIGGGIYEKFKKKNGKIFGVKETYKKDLLIKHEEFNNGILDGELRQYNQESGNLLQKSFYKKNKIIYSYNYFIDITNDEGTPYLKEICSFKEEQSVKISFGINGRANDFTHPTLHNITGHEIRENDKIVGCPVDFNNEGDILFVRSFKEGKLQTLNQKEELELINSIKIFECFYPNGNIMDQREMKNGKVHGSWKRYYEDGVLGYETNHIESKLNGKSISYFNNGEIMEESYHKNGKCESQISYHKNGNIKSEKNFLNGKEHGHSKIYYENGNIESEINFKNGQRNGRYTGYYDSGEVLYKGELINDLQEGLWQMFYENGKLKKENNFINGDIKSQTCWDTDGNKIGCEDI